MLVTALWMGYHFGCSMTSSWKKRTRRAALGRRAISLIALMIASRIQWSVQRKLPGPRGWHSHVAHRPNGWSPSSGGRGSFGIARLPDKILVTSFARAQLSPWCPRRPGASRRSGGIRSTVLAAWEGIRRTLSSPPDQAAPLMPPHLLDVVDACPTTRTWATPTPAEGIRPRRPARSGTAADRVRGGVAPQRTGRTRRRTHQRASQRACPDPASV
jgi:hypothetical protein